MTEHEPVPTVAPEAIARPPYERIGQGLERLLATTGWTVKEAFPAFLPRGAMHSHNHAERTIVLHPWIAPRVRAEVLLRESVKRLAEKQTKPRGKQSAEEPRDWLVQGLVARHYGMEVDERNVSAQASWDPTLAEELLVKRIVGAIEGEQPVSGPAERPTDGDGPSETGFESPKPRRTRAQKRRGEGGAQMEPILI